MPDGLSATAIARTLNTSLALNRHTLEGYSDVGGAIPVINIVGSQPFAREQGTTALTYLLFGPDVGPVQRVDLAERLAARQLGRPDDGLVGVTGAIPARQAQSETISGALPLVELCTVLLVVLAVGLHFRAVLAPLVCLLAIAVAYTTSVRLIAWIGERVGISVPREVEPVIVVLLFGIVTDYAIFLLSRFRRRLVDEPDARARGDRDHRGAGPDRAHGRPRGGGRRRGARRRRARLLPRVRPRSRDGRPDRPGRRDDVGPRAARAARAGAVLAAPAGARGAARRRRGGAGALGTAPAADAAVAPRGPPAGARRRRLHGAPAGRGDRRAAARRRADADARPADATASRAARTPRRRAASPRGSSRRP